MLELSVPESWDTEVRFCSYLEQGLSYGLLKKVEQYESPSKRNGEGCVS